MPSKKLKNTSPSKWRNPKLQCGRYWQGKPDPKWGVIIYRCQYDLDHKGTHITCNGKKFKTGKKLRKPVF